MKITNNTTLGQIIDTLGETNSSMMTMELRNGKTLHGAVFVVLGPNTSFYQQALNNATDALKEAHEHQERAAERALAESKSETKQ